MNSRSPLRVAICDDERLAVEYLGRLLAKEDAIELAGSSTDGYALVDLVRTVGPDLVLLDVEMPEIDGFDVVERVADLAMPDPPLICFVTAHQNFASQAFDAGAVDFLSKPVRRERLSETLRRARQALRDRQACRRLGELEAMLPALRQESARLSGGELWVARRGDLVPIDLARVERIVSEGPYSRIFADGASLLHREGIGQIAARLPPGAFLRIHRSHLIRLDRIEGVRRTITGGVELRLMGGDRVPVGRKYARDVREALGV